ncbi:putativeholliday junction resolvase [Acinetobacter phage vB_AbaP_Alexa]|nr:putativeholliday junction resolvase [Acinetobacter phage vB_AbaP_Alexa]
MTAKQLEHDIQNTIRNALAGQCHLFRANVGQGWTGDITKLPDGSLLIKNPRPFNTGLPSGFSDTFGWVPVTITQDMVGQTFARFIAGEVKTAKGKVRPDQEKFLNAVNRNGGVGDVWRSADDANRSLAKAHGINLSDNT